MSGMVESLCALLLSTLSSLPEGAFSGRVEGGWGYIGFSYALAWASLLGYALYLFFLRRQLQALPPEPSSSEAVSSEAVSSEGKPGASSSPPAL